MSFSKLTNLFRRAGKYNDGNRNNNINKKNTNQSINTMILEAPHGSRFAPTLSGQGQSVGGDARARWLALVLWRPSHPSTSSDSACDCDLGFHSLDMLSAG